MKRREFILALGASSMWPMVLRAQTMPVIGFIGITSSDEWKNYVVAFHEG